MAKKFIGSAALTPSSDSGFDLDAKGQIHGYSSTQFALDVGTANQSLIVDSSATAGIKWAASATSALSATGDILYASGANTLARLAKGDNDEILTLKSGLPSWEAAAAGGGGSYVRLDAQELGSDTGVITYTPGSALTEAKYAMIVVIIETEVTSSGTLQMEVNNDDSSSYFTDGQKYNSGSATVIDVSSATKWDIMDSTSTGTNSHTVVMLSMGDSAFAAARLRGTSQGSSQDLGYFVGLELDEQGTPPTITEIEVSNSAGNLKAGTKMTTFGVERS